MLIAIGRKQTNIKATRVHGSRPGHIVADSFSKTATFETSAAGSTEGMKSLASMRKALHDQSHQIFRAEPFCPAAQRSDSMGSADALKFQAMLYVVLDLAGKPEPGEDAKDWSEAAIF